ncbi:MAG: hypothetical protein LVQ96_07425 [Thermoplasmatales archaeon]|nr:hypothetical protein [Thermoplasmatales archaeon]
MGGKKIKMSIGKGNIYVDKSVVESGNSPNLILELEKERGPCTDVSCQIIVKLLIHKADGETDPSFVHIMNDSISLYLSPEVYDSIDKGRQDVEITTTLGKKFVAKGFIYTP